MFLCLIVAHIFETHFLSSLLERSSCFLDSCVGRLKENRQMQVARLPVQPVSPNDSDFRTEEKRSQVSSQPDDNKGKSDQSSQTSTMANTLTSTTTSQTTSVTTTRNISAPSSFIAISSPVPVAPGTVTVSSTQAITQIVVNPTTVLSSPPQTTPTQTITDKPSFLFNRPNNATVCGSLNFTWLYSGQSVIAISLVVQNHVGLSSVSPQSATAQPTASVTFHTLATGVPSDANDYLWAPVDINEGWYTAKAFNAGGVLGISAQSTPFFVSQGPFHLPCPTANTTISSTNPTATPVHSSGRATLRAADIVGIVVGSTAGVALLASAFVFSRFWRKELPLTDPKTRRPYLLY